MVFPGFPCSGETQKRLWPGVAPGQSRFIAGGCFHGDANRFSSAAGPMFPGVLTCCLSRLRSISAQKPLPAKVAAHAGGH